MSPRYTVPPEVMSTLKRDGIGWGHDLEAGTFHAPRFVRPTLMMRLKRKLK